MIFTLTKEGSNWEDDSQSMAHVEQRFGRHLHNFLTMARNDAVYYVCGPSSMIDETIHVLKDKKVCEENIIYEKWW
jgi:Na+-transporting NADH:ubiquinone oxidoreductase subunit NqrF